MGAQGSMSAKADAAMTSLTSSNAPTHSQIPEGDLQISLTHSSYAMKASVSVELGLVASFPGKKYVLVESIKEKGLIPAWNEANKNTPELQVKPGDAIVVVNGVYGRSDIMVEKMKEALVSLTLKRGNADVVAGATEEAASEPSTDTSVASTDTEDSFYADPMQWF